MKAMKRRAENELRGMPRELEANHVRQIGLRSESNAGLVNRTKVQGENRNGAGKFSSRAAKTLPQFASPCLR
jgi:hypothetical protein